MFAVRFQIGTVGFGQYSSFSFAFLHRVHTINGVLFWAKIYENKDYMSI